MSTLRWPASVDSPLGRALRRQGHSPWYIATYIQAETEAAQAVQDLGSVVAQDAIENR